MVAVKGTKTWIGAQLALADAELFLGEDDDGASLGCLVGQGRQLRHVGELLLAVTADREEVRGHAVAQRDRAGLVQQENLHVTSGFDRPSAHRQDVALHESVHAGDAYGGEQGADGRRDQTDEQRHQDDDRDRGAGEVAEGHQRDDDRDEDNGEDREEDRQCDLVRRLLPVGPFDEGDHPVDERLSSFRGDAHHDAVRQHLGATGDGGTVTTGFSNHRRRFTGDGRLVDRGDTFDDLAVGGDDVVGFTDDQVALLEQRGGDQLFGAVRTQPSSLGLRAHPSQRVRLGLPATFRHRLGEVGEHDRQDEPDSDRPREDARVGDGLDEGDDGADEHDEHDGVLYLDARIHLSEGIAKRLTEYLSVEETSRLGDPTAGCLVDRVGKDSAH